MQASKTPQNPPFIVKGRDAQALADTLRTLADMLQSGELLVDTGGLVVHPKITHILSEDRTTFTPVMGISVRSTLVLVPR